MSKIDVLIIILALGIIARRYLDSRGKWMIEKFSQIKSLNAGATFGKFAFVYDNKYYVISNNGRETLIFPGDKHGNITDYIESEEFLFKDRDKIYCELYLKHG